MAGSLKYFVYTTDTGNDFGILMDEDHGEAIPNADVTTTPSGLYGIPVNLTPRYARYQSTSGKRSLSIVICDETLSSDDLPQTITITSANGEVSEDATDNSFNLSALFGERFKPIKAVDTNLTDGDAS